jgi:PKD repeat protein
MQQRLYNTVQTSVYFSDSSDWTIPTISTTLETGPAHTFSVTIHVTDASGICRVILAYTDGQGSWALKDNGSLEGLTQSSPDTWYGTLPYDPNLEYFVQVVDSVGNVAVDDNQGRYYSLPLGAPNAAFTASPLTGDAPLTVVFTDTSTGAITSWAWDFGDEVTSTMSSPTHEYTLAGMYTVSLMVSGLEGNDIETQSNYIIVGEPPNDNEYYVYLPLILHFQ